MNIIVLYDILNHIIPTEECNVLPDFYEQPTDNTAVFDIENKWLYSNCFQKGNTSYYLDGKICAVKKQYDIFGRNIHTKQIIERLAKRHKNAYIHINMHEHLFVFKNYIFEIAICDVNECFIEITIYDSSFLKNKINSLTI